MKVKKKYIIATSLFIFILIIIVGSALMYMLSIYNLSLEDGKRIVKSTYSLIPASNSEINEHRTSGHESIDILHYEI